MWSAIIKIVLLLAYLIFAHRHLPNYFNAYRPSGDWPVFVTVWLSSLVALFLLAFQQRKSWRIAGAVLFSYASINALSYYIITGTPLNTIEVERLWQDIAFIDETFQFYGRFIFQAVLISSVLVIAILIPVSRFSLDKKAWRLLAAFSLMLPAFLVGRSVYKDGGGDSDAFPLFTAPFGFVGVLLYDNATRADPGPRQSVAWAATDSGIEKIVVLMDESVRGDYLDLNNPTGVQTHLSGHDDVINFGLAAAHANCSAASNLTFRYAARRQHFLQDEALRPSLWAFAKKAGYKTIYIDGQRSGNELQNFMNTAERKEIDQLIQHDSSVAVVDKDMKLAEQLRALLNSPGKAFIYVNKNGVHFPYENKYPSDKTPFLPRMTSTQVSSNESDQYGGEFGSVPFRNSYRNAVAWNTGEFFARLLPELDLTRTLIVYTSDHGQNFTKVWETGYLTHCTWGPAPAPEGTVPLAVLTASPQWKIRLHDAANRHFNKISQWNVPSSVLLFMGYPEQTLKQDYEPTLFADDPGRAEFVSTYFVRFGLHPVWNQPLHEPEK